jgi:hypothetical protein
MDKIVDTIVATVVLSVLVWAYVQTHGEAE